MEYRALPHGGEKISVIGLGSAGLHNASDAEVERTIDEAVDAGVNHFDFIPSESRPLAAMGRALRRHRADVHVQVHIGALYGSGAYGWTTDAKPAIAEFEQRLTAIGTDYTDESEYGKGEAADRMELLREFERAGIGVSVMKPFAGGQLLDAAQSPFGRALTRTQCIQYALDKPGVVTVLPGVHGLADLRDLLGYLDATPEERDYSELASMAPQSREARCVYCNHCQPCPSGIQVGLVNKYYDLARVGDELAAEHYRNLEHHAGECVGCGHCDSRCPFGVTQSSRMCEIAAYFGM